MVYMFICMSIYVLDDGSLLLSVYMHNMLNVLTFASKNRNHQDIIPNNFSLLLLTLKYSRTQSIAMTKLSFHFFFKSITYIHFFPFLISMIKKRTEKYWTNIYLIDKRCNSEYISKCFTVLLIIL